MQTIEKKYLDADGYLDDIWRLAAAVAKSGWRADVLVALWRGGAPAGVAVHEFLKCVARWDIRHAAMKCASYSHVGDEPGRVIFEGVEPILSSIRPGDKVLVVDDVFDTGRTAEAVKKALEERGAQMRFAAVYWKPGKNRTSLKPDYFVRDVGDEWIVFPHEIEDLSDEEICRKNPLLAQLVRSLNRERG